MFLKPHISIEIQNFEPKQITRAYVCIKFSEYPPPPTPPPGRRRRRRRWRPCFTGYKNHLVITMQCLRHLQDLPNFFTYFAVFGLTDA